MTTSLLDTVIKISGDTPATVLNQVIGNQMMIRIWGRWEKIRSSSSGGTATLDAFNG